MSKSYVSSLEDEIRELRRKHDEVDTRLRRVGGSAAAPSTANRTGPRTFYNAAARHAGSSTTTSSSSSSTDTDRASKRRLLDSNTQSREERDSHGQRMQDSARDDDQTRRKVIIQSGTLRIETVNSSSSSSSDQPPSPKSPSASSSSSSSDSSQPIRIVRNIGGVQVERKSRNEIPAFTEKPEKKETSDPTVQKRNKRLFGALLGHLQKAQGDLKTELESDVTKRKEELSKKIAQKTEEERSTLAEQQKVILRELRDKERELKNALDAKQREMRRVKEESKLREHYRDLGHFIKTSATPAIFWCPSLHNDTTRKLLADSVDAREKELDAALEAWRQSNPSLAPDVPSTSSSSESAEHSSSSSSSSHDNDSSASEEHRDSSVEPHHEVEEPKHPDSPSSAGAMEDD